MRVVEFGIWVAGPATAAVLADWGADVVKVEPPGGDPQRGLEGVASAGGDALPFNPTFDVTNRGKRSIALDLKSPEGRAVADELIAGADVLVTNMRMRALERLGLDYATLHDRHPRLVYALMTGYGTEGPERDRPGYDIGAYWSRAGLAASLAVPGSTPPFQRGAMGDRTAAAALAGGVAAALLARVRTGSGQLVSQSLFRWGVYTLSSDFSLAIGFGAPMATARREAMASPTVNCYRCADDRWFWLTGLERARHWPPLARAVGRPEWLDDPRFATSAARHENARVLIAELDALFATRERHMWLKEFDAHDVWYQPVNTVPEVLEDPLLQASGALAEVPHPEGGSAVFVNTPVDFDRTPAGPRGTAPAVGEHTDSVLRELGYSDERIASVRAEGGVG
ncbi:CaiB/BaiF CoA transferase family protein [Yinghuangia sp. YIM S09857]|uniref:CaiB/BaiF CoA transferase family protein n=1 Tax=Yinghuangia sp. YIM S09857 TaxID=3436929 RepID=UPI003F52F890